jgi:hypothetical protein
VLADLLRGVVGLLTLLWLADQYAAWRRGEISVKDANGRMRPLPAVAAIFVVIFMLAVIVASFASES